MERLRIFLASSDELKDERKEIEIFINRENKILIDRDLFLDLIIWEDLEHTFHTNRVQNRFNDELLKSDFVVCLFHKKVGKFTNEEYELAYENFKKFGKPEILVMFKKASIDPDEINDDILAIKKLRESIITNEQISEKFSSNEQLILILKKQLDLHISKINNSAESLQNNDFKFEIKLDFSSVIKGYSGVLDVDNVMRAIKIDVLNVGNKINYVDSIKFCTLKNDLKKYHIPVLLYKDILMKTLLPEFGQPIQVGKKISYHYPIDDIIKAILSGDNKPNFSVLVRDELGHNFEKIAEENIVIEITEYCKERELL